MKKYYDKLPSEMNSSELIDYLFQLGSIEHMQVSYEMDSFYEAVWKLRDEIIKRME